ncbi:MAG: glycoside hydrolase family 28 protein [Myxococcota bacterium]|nr:glycoside hydrolase family 28 protein [Myxococcota bacterium]
MNSHQLPVALLTRSFALVLISLAVACGSSSSVPETDGGGGGGGGSGSTASSGTTVGSGIAGSGSGSAFPGTGMGSGSSGAGVAPPEAGISGDDGAASSGGTGALADAGPIAESGAPPETGVVNSPGDGGVGWGSVPGILARIVPPTFPNVDCDVTKYGGNGDGVTDNTAAFAAAIADCVAKGGGRVVAPAGTFFTGPIELKSNINLYVAAGATIRFTTDPAKYLPPVEVSWEGSLAQNYRPLIWAHDATNVAITGTGTIDGNASKSNWYQWLQLQKTDQGNLRQQDANGVPPAQRIYGAGHYLRPGLIEFMRCTNVLFDGFTAMNSPFWTIHPVLSKNITARNFRSVSDITVVNTDGFDPESCTDVLIQNASIQVGDDAVAIKAGRDRDAMTYYKPSENIVIQKSTMLSTWGGVTIGSEMSGGVRNVYVEDCTFSSAAGNLIYGFFIKSAVTRGGYIHDIYARNITVGTVRTFLYLTGHYVAGAVIGPTNFASFDNINIDMATVARTSQQPFFIAGSDASKPANGIHLSNITVNASAAPALAAGSGHYQNLTTTNVTVNGSPFSPPASAP